MTPHAAAPQRLPHGHRPPRGRLAPPAHRPDRRHRRRGTTSELARIAERGKLDSVFFADGLAVWGERRAQHSRRLRAAHPAGRDRRGHRAHRPDRDRLHHLQRAVPPGPHVRLPRPHQRRPRRLEHRHLRGPSAEARNFGSTSARAHAERYARAAEFLDVALELWDSWEDDALVARQGTRGLRRHRPGARASTTRRALPGARARSTCRGRRRATRCWCRPARRRTARRSPPGTPRRSSPRSRRSPTGRRSTATSRRGSPRYGRQPGPGQDPARHRAGHRRAPRPRPRALEQELDDLIVPEYALRQLSGMLGVDLTDLPLDAPAARRLPAEDAIEGNKSRFTAGRRPGPRASSLTVRAAARPPRRRPRPPRLRRHARAGRGPIEEWFTQGAADGFNIMPPCCPAGWTTSSTTSCRSCSARGLFRTEYDRARPCASTTACRARPARTPRGPGAGMTTVERPGGHRRAATGEPGPVPRTAAAAGQHRHGGHRGRPRHRPRLPRWDRRAHPGRLTATSFTSVSLDPPLVSFCLGHPLPGAGRGPPGRVPARLAIVAAGWDDAPAGSSSSLADRKRNDLRGAFFDRPRAVSRCVAASAEPRVRPVESPAQRGGDHERTRPLPVD